MLNKKDLENNAKTLIPVLHVYDFTQTQLNLELLARQQIKQVFLICHGGEYTGAKRLFALAKQVKEFGFWVGVNFLGYDTVDILSSFKNEMNGVIDALWYDNSFAGVDNFATKRIFEARNEYNSQVQLYGGVAFKYCQQPSDLREACEVASKHMDVVVTSGSGTGKAADVEKIQLMQTYLAGIKPLAIASGITPENVMNYSADVFMVATGISNSEHYFDENRVKALYGILNANKASQIESDIALIKDLAVKEASLINMMFGKSNDLGILAMHSAVDSFVDFLRSKNPMFIPAMSIEYRTFVVELLKNIDTEYQAVTLSEMLVGKINITAEDLHE